MGDEFNHHQKCMKCGKTHFISLMYIPDYPVCDVCITKWVGDKI